MRIYSQPRVEEPSTLDVLIRPRRDSPLATVIASRIRHFYQSEGPADCSCASCQCCSNIHDYAGHDAADLLPSPRLYHAVLVVFDASPPRCNTDNLLAVCTVLYLATPLVTDAKCPPILTFLAAATALNLLQRAWALRLVSTLSIFDWYFTVRHLTPRLPRGFTQDPRNGIIFMSDLLVWPYIPDHHLTNLARLCQVSMA